MYVKARYLCNPSKPNSNRSHLYSDPYFHEPPGPQTRDPEGCERRDKIRQEARGSTENVSVRPSKQPSNAIELFHLSYFSLM
mmetsp:Transcript_23003/g.44899  ORF Transcript_23003/g.44899 Transcript_23003/m.44899 type:complete len:82 (-) Transcript_23003:411-656(-)